MPDGKELMQQKEDVVEIFFLMQCTSFKSLLYCTSVQRA